MIKKEDFKSGLRRRYLAVFDEVYKDVSAKSGIKEGEFCDILGLRRGTPSEIRAGKRSPTTEDIFILCDKYNYDISYIISGKKRPPGKLPDTEITIGHLYELLKEIKSKLK